MRTLMLGLAIATAVSAMAACRNDAPTGEPSATASSPAPRPRAPDPAAPPADGMPAPPAPSPSGHAVPARFQGDYASDAAACADPAHESRLAIASDSIGWHESSGPVTQVSSGENELSLTARLTGEGDTREASYRFRLSGDGGTLTDVGSGMVRYRCR